MTDHSRPTPDAIPPWGRVGLYALAIVAPGVGVLLHELTNSEAVTLFVTIMGVLGPLTAINYAVKHENERPANYRAGYTDALLDREPDPELRGRPPTTGEDHGPVQDNDDGPVD